MQDHDRRSHARPAPLSDTPDEVRADLVALIAIDRPASSRSVDEPGNSDPVPNYPDAVGVVANAPRGVAGLLKSEGTPGGLPKPGDTPDAIRADLDALAGGPRQFGEEHVEPRTADAARAIHLRRQLAKAAEHGAALLASLGLPRLVGPGFVPLDGAAIGDAVEAAVAALDEMDADPEAEPWLGWSATLAGVVSLGDAFDREAEDLDEFTLGWADNASQIALDHGSEDNDSTAPERHGRGFVRCGPDDVEDGDIDQGECEPRLAPRADRFGALHV